MRLRYIPLVLLVIFCCGCTVQTNAPTPATTVDGEGMQLAAQDCFDLWLNTLAPQQVIDDAETMTDSKGDPIDEPILVRDDDGNLHAETTSDYFEYWVTTNYGVPWADIKTAILNGVGCPYDPVVKAKLDQETQDCLQVWVNRDAPQAAIEAGLATTGPDGTPVQPVLTSNTNGQYAVDIHSDSFQVWVTNHDSYFVPWDNIYTQAIADEGCPYGPSPDQTPAATAS